MSSHMAIGGMDGTDPVASTDSSAAGALKTNDQPKTVVDATQAKGPSKWPMGRVAKYYAVSLAVATLLTAAGLLIAKFACHQNIDLTGKTFWIAAGTSLGGAIVLPLLTGGGITLYKAYRKDKKEKSAQNVIDQWDKAGAGLDSLKTEEAEAEKAAERERNLAANLAQMDSPQHVFDSPSTAAKKVGKTAIQTNQK